MAETTYKILLFMKRRPGMTLEAFKDYYETHHAPLCEKYARGISRYMRRYLTAHRNPETGATEELAYDVITELWFEDKALFDGTLKYITTTIMPDDIVADEKNFFDRSSFRIATVTECETDMSQVGK